MSTFFSFRRHIRLTEFQLNFILIRAKYLGSKGYMGNIVASLVFLKLFMSYNKTWQNDWIWLQGVVVVDNILRHKSILQLPTSSREERLASLADLQKKIPPRHVMLSTSIGMCRPSDRFLVFWYLVLKVVYILKKSSAHALGASVVWEFITIDDQLQ